ncbi:MAG TPA: glycosyltransferase [Anaerolineae bacterium]|nr:glycosyltransferase [Anaerolineae bacterium]
MTAEISWPVKILYFITELNIGGAEKVLVHLISKLDRTHFDPIVVCLYDGNGPIAAEIRALNVPVIDLNMRTRWDVTAIRRFYQLVRREKPVIIHASLFHANVIGRLVGRMAGVPLIITCRQNISIGGRWREQINRLTASWDDKVVAVCELAREAELEHAGVAQEKVVTIYNTIDPTVFHNDHRPKKSNIRNELGIPPDLLLIGSVGRLHPQKGLSYLLEATAQLKKQSPVDFRLLVVGDGQLRDDLIAQSRTLGIADRTIFAGARTDVPDILGELDIFAFPSLWEGLPLALLEAMAAGLPVVATAVGGTPEVVQNGQTGILVPPGDHQSLAIALERLITEPDLRLKMGQAGLNRIQQAFTVEQMVEKYHNLYFQLIRQKYHNE